MFSALRYRDFRLVWTGALISTTGTWMQTVAQSWVVLSMTGSALLLGTDSFLSTLPMILFSLLGGVAADRFDRRKMLLTSQYLQMTFAAILGLLIYTGRVQVWHIFLLSFLTGTAQSLSGPSYQALLPTMVRREDVPNAVAMNSIQFNTARVIGPMLAGIALASFGAAACFGLNALSFVAVIAMLMIIRTPFLPEERKGKRSLMEDLREGFHFMRDSPALMQLSVLGFLGAFFGVPLVTMLPVVTRDVFHMGATGYSHMMTVYGVGSVLGALAVAATGHVEKKGRISLIFIFVFAAVLGGFAFSRSYLLSMVLAFLAGAALIGVTSMIFSLVQLATTEAMRGRVMAMFMLAFRGGMPLGNLASGFLAERFSITTALAIDAACLGVAGLYYAFSRNGVRDL